MCTLCTDRIQPHIFHPPALFMSLVMTLLISGQLFLLLHVRENMQNFPVCVWLTSLGMMSFFSTHFVTYDSILFWNNIPLHVLCSSVDRNLSQFHILAMVSNATLNIGMQVSLWYTDFSYFGYIYIPRNGIHGLRNTHTILYNGSSNLHSHQQYTWVPFSLHSHQDFFYNSIVNRVSWYLIRVLKCISLVAKDTEHFLYNCWSFVFHLLRNVYLEDLSNFNRLFELLLLFFSCLYILDINCHLKN
jgi:hypothetical protein